MERINLYQLAAQATGISKTVGEFLAEAAQVCLETQGHQSGTIIKIIGLHDEKVVLEWEKTLEAETLLSWKDFKEATEYGATAIALLIILHFENYNFVERLPQHSIGDYFLKKTDLDNIEKTDEAFLEISGIFKETQQNAINLRINQKKKQLSNKPISELNVLIAVVEFSKPKAKIIKI